MPKTLPATHANIAQAARALARGELVAFPTETVYGLGADATSSEAVAKIFEAKGRPADHPLIVHVANGEEARAWSSDWTLAADKLAEAFWPGPLTLIVARADWVPLAVTGGQDSVGLRVPSHPVALQLLNEMKHARGGQPSGVAAPSANRFGHVSPTTVAHVASEFAVLDLTILEGGACEVGVESTIIDCRSDPVRILRPGRISHAQLEAALGATVAVGTESASPRVSGALDSHYAPTTPAYMLTLAQMLARLGSAEVARVAPSVGALLLSAALPVDARLVIRDRIGATAAQAEHDLYAILRELDALGLDEIWVETPPQDDAWLTVQDRLKRATFRG